MTEFGVLFLALGILVGVAVLVVGLFIVFRWIVLWYWKIDRHMEIMERIDRRLAKMEGEETPAALEAQKHTR